MTRSSPLLAWRGAKSVHAKKIVAHLPSVPILDLFGGGGSIVTAHPQGGAWNDADHRLFRLAAHVKADPVAYQQACRTLPTDPEGAAWLWAHIRNHLDTVPPHLFAWAAQFTFGATFAGRVHITDMNLKCWKTHVNGAVERSQAWSKIVLLTRPYQEALRLLPDVPVFADPPYPGTVTCGYAAAVDHAELNALLDNHMAPVWRTGWSGDCAWPGIPLTGGKQNKTTYLYARDGFQ
ncbi:MAG: hypothetical protein OXC29_25255 [Rhodococcus sp.]|nr:hypothetical protein [Rhodococcus sp. (in: high G+C Gram-positive bacteria)]